MANDVAVTPQAVPLVRQFSKQIAGHAIEKGSSKPGMMKHADGCLLKPILSPPRGPRELQFYQNVFNGDNVDEVDVALRSLLPLFHGIFSNKSENKGDADFLKLEDLTERFTNPCILDVKMGARTYDSEASEDKIKREQRKYKHTKVLGFCIPGMQVYNLKTRQYICKSKEYGKKLNSITVKDAFRLYLNSDIGMSSVLIKSFLLHLNKVRNWFLTQTKYVFFASSLLLIYDANSLFQCTKRKEDNMMSAVASAPLDVAVSRSDLSAACSVAPEMSHNLYEVEEETVKQNISLSNVISNPNEGCQDELITMTVVGHKNSFPVHSSLEDGEEDKLSDVLNLTDVRMIDFAHVFNSSARDENYLHGLNNLITILEYLLMEAK